MNEQILAQIKMAYAAGSQQALLDAGCTEKVAADESDALAEAAMSDPTTRQKVLAVLFGPMGAGLSAPEGKGWGTYGKSYARGALGGLGGAAAGGAGGAGLGALASLISRGRIPMGVGALGGGALGFAGGGTAGGIKGTLSGQERGLKGQPTFGSVE
jgi:hypothetical protein